MWAIYRKELRTYLLSPVAWVIWAVALGVHGFVFPYFLSNLADVMLQRPDANVTETMVIPMFNFFRFLLLFFVPVLAARLFAEERHTGTLELLFTYPLTEMQLLMGKLLAVISVATMTLVFYLPLVFFMGRYLTLEWPVILCTLFSYVLLATAFLSFSTLASSITNSQLVAMLISYGLLITLWLAPLVLRRLDITESAKWLTELGLTDHLESFSKGLLNSQDILFYCSFAAVCVYITLKQLESRKWKG